MRAMSRRCSLLGGELPVEGVRPDLAQPDLAQVVQSTNTIITSPGIIKVVTFAHGQLPVWRLFRPTLRDGNLFEQRISISFLERISWLEIGGQSRQLSLSQDIVGILFSRQGTV